MIATLFWSGLALLWAFDGWRLRGRARALATLNPSDEPTLAEHRFITRPGVTLDEAVMRAASTFARAQDLDVVDLIPRDFPAWRAFLLLQTIDFRRFRNDRLARAFSAGEAILVRTSVLDRMREPDLHPEDALAFSQLAARLKQHAPTRMDYAVAPGLRASQSGWSSRALIALAFGDFALPIIWLQIALAVAGPFVTRYAGIAALALMHLQGAVALLGTAIRPRRLLVHVLLRTPMDLFGTLGRGSRTSREGSEKLRGLYAKLMGSGTVRFFEPRREDCPYCGGHQLRRVLKIRDHFQFKPGRFSLDRCTSCGHIFQNPRLSTEGLDFYYRDFYDGLGEAGLESLFASTPEPYLARARAVQAHAEKPPARWIDIGTGHGHFCLVAREVFPDTEFEGVDLGSSIEEAERRGWITRGYRALFPAIADELAARPYDVVSMSHYLEHTREQSDEIAAAAKVLRPGGLLMIEVPDPESRYGRLLGRLWLPWFQPQHQHFLSVQRLEAILHRHGFVPVAWQRREAHQRVDLFFAVGLVFHRLAPPPDLPWRPPSGHLRRAYGRIVWLLAIPFLVASRLADEVVAPVARRPGWSNTFRVVARRSA